MSTAYHLMRKGYGRVTLIEKGALGDGSSSRAAGIITGLLMTRTSVLVRKLCLELFRRLSLELKGYEFNPVGCLNLFTPSSWNEREGLLEMYRELEAPFEVLDTTEMKRRWPILQPPDDSVGLMDPLGGYSEPHDYVPALAARIRELGVEVREREMVREIVTTGGRVSGVKTTSGFLETDAVIGAVDSWTRRLLSSSVRSGVDGPRQELRPSTLPDRTSVVTSGLPGSQRSPAGWLCAASLRGKAAAWDLVIGASGVPGGLAGF